MQVIKNTFEIISQPLIQIINLSLLNGYFPNKLKIAKVIPIYKADSPEFFTNYRPISLLPNFSKFFEKFMHNRITNFIESFDILYSRQFGFRKKHSTVLSLTYLINNISTSIDRKEITAGVFLDLSKAFDTLNHEILFAKSEHYGIRGIALQWIKSYFSDRKQFVQFNETSSFKQTTRCGVPQGSILGPLLFLLYINDLPNAARMAETLLFADDTSIFYSHSDPKHLISVLNTELTEIDNWMKSNKLSVNIKKTSYIIFKSRQKKISVNLPAIVFDNQHLKQEQVIKFLGIYIDENHTWKPHINYVCKKISKSIGIIYRSRFELSTNAKLSLYYTLIYPYLTYCNIVWSSTYVSSLNRILLLQKRAVRAITNSDYRAHSTPLFLDLKILDIYKLNTFHIAKFMFMYHHNLLPQFFLNLFFTSYHVHNYNTRNVTNYRSHPCRTNVKKFTILYLGPKIWNSLPSSVVNPVSLISFRKKLLRFLLKE